jgi:protein TonB
MALAGNFAYAHFRRWQGKGSSATPTAHLLICKTDDMLDFRVVLFCLGFLLARDAAAAESAATEASSCKAAVPNATCNCAAPVYPPYDLVNENQGTVKARVMVNADGTVARVVLERSSGYKGLDKAALEFFQRSCYLAGKNSEGVSVPGELTMQYVFSLR